MRLPLAMILLCAISWAWGFWARPTWRWQLDECREAQTSCAYQLTVDAVLYRECAGIVGIKSAVGSWYASRYLTHCRADYARIEGRTVQGGAIGPVEGK